MHGETVKIRQTMYV